MFESSGCGAGNDVQSIGVEKIQLLHERYIVLDMVSFASRSRMNQISSAEHV
jgi:hypothetical protein